MAAVIFKRLPNQMNGRRRYSARFDSAGAASERKKQIPAAEIMRPKYIVGPTYMPGGSDQNAPYVRTGRM